MASTAQKLFKKIVLHNHLMDAATCDRLLVQVPDPEQLVRELVKRQKLPASQGTALLSLYRKQLEKIESSSEIARQAADSSALDEAASTRSTRSPASTPA